MTRDESSIPSCWVPGSNSGPVGLLIGSCNAGGLDAGLTFIALSDLARAIVETFTSIHDLRC